METIQAELRKSMHYLSMKKRDHAADKIDALQAQVEALTAELESWRFTNRIDELQRAHDSYKKDAERYRAIREGLEVDENSGIVVSLVDDFGGETLNGEVANNAIDAAIAKGTDHG